MTANRKSKARVKRALTLLPALVLLLALPTSAVDPQSAGTGSAAPASGTAGDALRTCTRCHDESDPFPVLSILKTRHAVMADPDTPFAREACVTCHGASAAHMEAPADAAERAAPDIVYDGAHASTAAEQSGVCVDCHAGGDRTHWRGSAHESEEVACSSCHVIHTGNDPVLATETQPDTCFQCHKRQRAETRRPFTHPIREGEMACTGCHNPHGSAGPSLLTETTVNETCYDCHAEKRGPFLWEHQPVREDCTHCHRPHGSVHAAMLTSRGPFLCQQCHLAQFHPSTAYSGTGLPGESVPSGAQQMLGKNCMNCHSQVHGSNHPSGVRKTR
ncbi:MAG TPA: DmsE family decaheme c-type cytochrome [Xanthomonadaceae bacterium]|nr:DmsE family decaheme c-type cytochrome [Xanthomonadaceae bacterium]